MPELPEVEIVRRGLAPVLSGHRLVQVIARRPDLRFALPPDLVRRTRGRRVVAVDRRAKYLLFRLDDGTVWLAHLGMSGRFHVFADAPPPPGPHDHVDLVTDAGATVRFRDPRRFGFMDLLAADALALHPMLCRLGPEPLSDGFTGAVLAAALAGRLSPIKTALLDQRTVAGLGNIYVSESLFRAGLSPRRIAATISGRRADRLVDAVRAVLEESIAAGGSTLRDHRRPSGEIGAFQDTFAVYGRAGERCPGCTCDGGPGGGIRRIVQSGRSTFYCPRRQR